MPLLTALDISHNLGLRQLLDHIQFTIEPGERTCLVGRNGAGKSTLFKIIEGKIEPDSGELVRQSNIQIASLAQDVPEHIEGSIFDVVLSGLQAIAPLLRQYEALLQQADPDEQKLHALQEKIDHANAWTLQQKVHTILSKLDLDGQQRFNALSGGMKRRVLLAQALVGEPDILLLDEPTNHLDIEAVQWLEQFLPSLSSSIIFITHDRMFLQNVATRIIELDRGKLFTYDCRYHQFLQRQAERFAIEDKENSLFDKRLEQEEAWIRQGIKARRTRNEGRVRSLEAMRKESEARQKRHGHAKLFSTAAESSGKRVIRAKNVSLTLGDKALFSALDIDIMRGDKIGILGPNGCGKSSLIRVLLGESEADTGTVKHGTQLEVAYFDQLRGQLDPQKSVLDNIAGGSDFIECNGKSVHIYAYLRRYLFSPERARTLVAHLSGGERNRCLLAKVLSKANNVLVLDEPTNDLDLDTLELLEDLLIDYTGTLILVSHDRSFINNVVDRTIAFEGNGQVGQYVGGYDDWKRQSQPQPPIKKAPTPATKTEDTTKPKSNKLSYNQVRRLKQLPQLIQKLEDAIEQHHQEMADPSFYQQDDNTIKTKTQQLQQDETDLAYLYKEWEQLEAEKAKR